MTLSQFASTVAASTQYPGYWDSNIEFWISNSDPRTSTNAGVYAEIIMFLGWEANRQSATGGWPCSVTTGNTSITTAGPAMTLCHQSDTWSSGWRFFNFIVNNGPLSAYSQKMDIKAILDWIMANYSGFNTNMWLTRIEVGTEVDDTTAGQGKITNAVFEVNGTTRAPQFGQ